MKLILFAFVISVALASCSRQDSGVDSISEKKYKSIFQYEADIEKPIIAKKSNLAPENKFIRKYMEMVYGAYRPEADCWLSPESEDAFRYCMEIKRVNNISINGREYKFVEANGLFVNHRKQVDPHNAPHVAPGVSGLFVFTKQGDGWLSVSSIPIFESKSWGYSGVNDKSFTQFGPDVYGWQISDGGMWQGQIVESLFFVAFLDNKLRIILDFPISFNADGFGDEELIKTNFENMINIDTTKVLHNLYFLNLLHNKKGIRKKYIITYNNNEKKYNYPEGIERKKSN